MNTKTTLKAISVAVGIAAYFLTDALRKQETEEAVTKVLAARGIISD